jgi:hypothetical protein
MAKKTKLTFAQEASKNNLWKVSDFSRGLNTKATPINLPQQFCTIAENVRFGDELNTLSKRNELLLYGTADTTEKITGMHRIYLADGTKTLIVTHGDEIEKGSDTAGTFTAIFTLVTGDYPWQWLTWHDMAIGTDGYNQPIKYDGSSASATYLGSCLATATATGAGPSGTYTYKISYYTASYEVILNQASNSVTVSNKDINLSMIPIAPDTYGGEDVIGRKVYRIKNGGATYYLLSNGTITNNTATTLTDSDADGELSATTYPAGDATYTPPKGKFCIVHKNRLWIANNPTYPSRIYYSEDASPDIFLPTAYFNIRQNDGDEITFVKNLLGILTIGKQNSIQKLYTDRESPTADWSISDPFSLIGCQAPYSAVNTPLGILYLARDGIYQFNGQQTKLISEAVTPEIKDILPSNITSCWAEFHKNIYYLAYTSEKTGATENNRVLLLDTLSNSYSTDILSVNAFTTFSSGTDWDILYMGSSADGKVYAYTKQDYEVVHRKHADFTGTWDDARYIPTGIPGGNANSPVIEIAWTETIDEVLTAIDDTSGDIDRPDTGGSYISQALEVGATSYDKLYWNERFPASGCDVTFQIRSASTAAGLSSEDWSSEFTDPTGSDISGETANTFVQYKANLSTTDIDYSPELYKANNYVVRLTYKKEGAVTETTVPMRWKSGWTDLGHPGQKKSLRKILVLYDSESTGTLNLTFSNWEGDEDEFEIDLKTYPDSYSEYFTGGLLLGKMFNLEISESSLNDLKIRKVYVWYDTEPFI